MHIKVEQTNFSLLLGYEEAAAQGLLAGANAALLAQEKEAWCPHVLHLPQDGRHYLISDLDPAGLARRYRWWSWFHLAIFFAALTALPFLWHMDG